MATPTTLPASFTAGQVLTAAQMNNLRGAFRILQVVAGSTTTATTTTSSSYQTSTLTATITPSSTSSTILAYYTGSYGGSSNVAQMYTALFRGTVAGTNLSENTMYANSSTGYYGTMAKAVIDTPATTSATTYTVGFRSGGGAMTCTAQQLSTQSTLILMEISA